MRRYYIYQIVPVSVNATKHTFNIPIEFKKIIGVLSTCSNTVSETVIDMKIDNTEIVPRNFNLKLINFNGFSERDRVLLPINLLNRNALVELNITPEASIVGATIKFYFEVEL